MNVALASWWKKGKLGSDLIVRGGLHGAGRHAGRHAGWRWSWCVLTRAVARVKAQNAGEVVKIKLVVKGGFLQRLYFVVEN